MARDTVKNPRPGPKAIRPTYTGPKADVSGLPVEDRRAVCRYAVHREYAIYPRMRYPDGSLITPFGTVIVGGDLNYLTNLGGTGNLDAESVAAVETARPDVKAALDAWIAWGRSL